MVSALFRMHLRTKQEAASESRTLRMVTEKIVLLQQEFSTVYSFIEQTPDQNRERDSFTVDKGDENDSITLSCHHGP